MCNTIVEMYAELNIFCFDILCWIIFKTITLNEASENVLPFQYVKKGRDQAQSS